MKLGEVLSDETTADLESVAQTLPKGEMLSDGDYALALELERRWLTQPESDSEAR